MTIFESITNRFQSGMLAAASLFPISGGLSAQNSTPAKPSLPWETAPQNSSTELSQRDLRLPPTPVTSPAPAPVPTSAVFRAPSEADLFRDLGIKQGPNASFTPQETVRQWAGRPDATPSEGEWCRYDATSRLPFLSSPQQAAVLNHRLSEADLLFRGQLGSCNDPIFRYSSRTLGEEWNLLDIREGRGGSVSVTSVSGFGEDAVVDTATFGLTGTASHSRGQGIDSDRGLEATLGREIAPFKVCGETIYSDGSAFRDCFGASILGAKATAQVSTEGFQGGFSASGPGMFAEGRYFVPPIEGPNSWAQPNYSLRGDFGYGVGASFGARADGSVGGGARLGWFGGEFRYEIDTWKR